MSDPDATLNERSAVIRPSAAMALWVLGIFLGWLLGHLHAAFQHMSIVLCW